MTVKRILADYCVSISEFKQNPQAVMDNAGGARVAVLNRNQPSFYCIPAEQYEEEGFLNLNLQMDDADIVQAVRTALQKSPRGPLLIKQT